MRDRNLDSGRYHIEITRMYLFHYTYHAALNDGRCMNRVGSVCSGSGAAADTLCGWGIPCSERGTPARGLTITKR